MSDINVFVNEYAIQGLRTLILANRVIDELYYESWSTEYHVA